MAKPSAASTRTTTPSKRKQGDARKPTPTPAQSTSEFDLAQRIAWIALLALVFLVPLAITNLNLKGSSSPPLTYDQFDTVKVFLQRTLTLIALAAWAWHMFIKGGKLRRSPVEWLILAFLGWVALSAVFSIHVPTALFGKYRRYEGLFSFINYAAIYFLFIQFGDRAKRLRELANVFFASSVIVSVYGIMQFLGVDILAWGQLPFEQNRAFSTFGNPDLLGPYIVMAMPIALALVFTSDDMRWRAVYWVGFLLNVWCWIVAFTRGAWIGGAAALVALAVGLVVARAKWRTMDWVAIALVAVVGIAVISWSLSSPSEVTNAVKRLQTIFDTKTGSGFTRTEIMKSAVQATLDRPLFGFGADTFRLVFPKYKTQPYVAAAGYLSVADNVHDYPLQLAAGVGIPGMILLYAVFVWVAVRSGRLAFSRDGSVPQRERLLLLGFWAACFGYIVNMMFGLSVTGTTSMLWVLMGALIAPTAISRDVTAPRWGQVAAVAGVVLALAGCFFWTRWLLADHQYLNARLQSSVDARVPAAEAAVRLNPFNDMYRAEVGLAYNDAFIQYISQAQQAQSQGLDSAPYTQAAQQMLAKAEQELLSAIAFVPDEYDNYVFLASLYNIAGTLFDDSAYHEKAAKIARAGIAIEEYGPAIRYQYAQALFQLGKRDDAIKELEYAVKLDPAFSDGAIALAKQYTVDGRYDEAIAVLKTAIIAKPDASADVSRTLQAVEASRAAAGASGGTTQSP